jgi:hypothetical protein
MVVVDLHALPAEKAPLKVSLLSVFVAFYRNKLMPGEKYFFFTGLPFMYSKNCLPKTFLTS